MEVEPAPETQQKKPVSKKDVFVWCMIAIGVIAIAVQTSRMTPYISDLLKHGLQMAKIYGNVWFICAILACILPLAGPLLSRLFNRGAKYETQIENAGTFLENATNNGKEYTEEQLKRASEAMEELEKRSQEQDDKPPTEEEIAEFKPFVEEGAPMPDL